jgi:hypothetical protein
MRPQEAQRPLAAPVTTRASCQRNFIRKMPPVGGGGQGRQAAASFTPPSPCSPRRRRRRCEQREAGSKGAAPWRAQHCPGPGARPSHKCPWRAPTNLGPLARAAPPPPPYSSAHWARTRWKSGRRQGRTLPTTGRAALQGPGIRSRSNLAFLEGVGAGRGRVGRGGVGWVGRGGVAWGGRERRVDRGMWWTGAWGVGWRVAAWGMGWGTNEARLRFDGGVGKWGAGREGDQIALGFPGELGTSRGWQRRDKKGMCCICVVCVLCVYVCGGRGAVRVKVRERCSCVRCGRRGPRKSGRLRGPAACARALARARNRFECHRP